MDCCFIESCLVEYSFSNIVFLLEPIKLFHATGLFLYPLKLLENQRSSDVFRGYKNRAVAWNGLMPQKKLQRPQWHFHIFFMILECFLKKKMVQAFSLQKYCKGEPGYKWVTFFLME